MRALKMRSAGQPSEVDNNQFRAIIDADPLTTAREAAVELNINHSTVIQHLKQIGKRKISGCLMNWLEVKKIIILKCHLLLFYATTMNNFSFRLWHVTKSGFSMTTGDDRLSWWTKKKLQSTSQSHTYTKKKVMVTVWWSAAPLIHYSFLNTGETIRLRSTLSKLMSATENAMPAAGISQQKRPNSSPWQSLTACRTTNTSKVEQIGLWGFASSVTFTWPLTNWLPLLQASI